MDSNKTLRKVKDEYSVIPSRIAKGLKKVIGLKVELDQSTKAVLASESLIRLFVELVGHFRTFITLNPENKNHQFQVCNKLFFFTFVGNYDSIKTETFIGFYKTHRYDSIVFPQLILSTDFNKLISYAISKYYLSIEKKV